MSLEKISTILPTTPSGMRASSAAANSEVRTVPLPMRVAATSGAVSTREANRPCGVRSTTRRLKVPSSSGAQRALSLSRAWLSLASTVTVRPARPSTCARNVGSVRRKAAARGSSTPRRASSASAVSLARVASERNSLKLCTSSTSI